MRNHIFNPLLFIMFLFLFFITSDGFAQVPKKDFEDHKDKTNRSLLTQDQIIQQLRDSIKLIDHKIVMENETLTAAKTYSENADKLSDRFLYHVDILLSLTGLLIALFGGIIFFFIRNFLNDQKKRLDQEFEEMNSKIEALKKLDEEVKDLVDTLEPRVKKTESLSSKLDKTIASIDSQQTNINRLMDTENTTMMIKESSDFLVIKLIDSDKNIAFDNLIKAIMIPFDKTPFEIMVNHPNKVINDPKFIEFLELDNPLSLVLINDDLIDTINDDVQNWAKDDELMFKSLIEKKIGLALYGEAFLNRSGIEYRTFAKVPSTLYGNINDLLKYMVADKGLIKKKQ